MSAKAPAKGHTPKHTSSKKHQHHASKKHHPVHHKKAATAHGAGHHVTAKAKHATHAKARGFAVGDLLPVCAFEALAMSLRLAGQFVHDDEVAGLWDLAGAPPFGASLAAALDAARLHGLAGFRPQWGRLERLGPVRVADEFGLPRRDDPALPLGPFEDFFAGDAHGLTVTARFGLAGCRPRFAPVVETPALEFAVGCPAVVDLDAHCGVGNLGDRGEVGSGSRVQLVEPVHGLILGIDVPGPHCVLATPDGWWSWGELHDPWPARIEEAWAVSWS